MTFRPFESGPMLAVISLLGGLGVAPDALAICTICAGLGTFILTRHTVQLGVMSYVINFLALFAGAIGANVLLAGVRLPLGFSIERPLIISIGGMLFASLIMILVMPRNR